MMDFNIRELADSFSKLLPHDNEKLKLSDIDSSGIPFLVRKRIIQIVREKFSQSIRSPGSEWADLQSSGADAIWNSYLQQMTDLLEVPADKVNDVLHDAVDFSLKLAVQPRKTIVKTLFENKDNVSKDDVDLLMDRFVVNRHLAFALSRYMEKREKDTLGIDEARQVLRKVDQKLTESYNSLDWMEAVKPIFNVAGPLVPSGYIRVFFEEKEMPRVARKYDLLDTEISETDFVEVMSSADLLDMSGFEEEQPALFSTEDDSDSGNERVETDEAEEQNKDPEEPVISSMSDIPASGDKEEDGKELADELDDETEWSTLEREQQEPNLLELFQEGETVNRDEDNTDLIRNDGDEEKETDKPSEEFETEFESDSVENEVVASDDIEDEESVLREEPEEDETDLTDFEEGKLEENEDILPDEERNDQQSEMPREKELESEDDEPFEEWDEDEEEIEEGSLLDQFTDSDEDSDGELKEESATKVTSIYDELNLSPVEEDEPGAEEDEDISDTETDDSASKVEIPFEPNDRLEEAPDDQKDDDELRSEEDPDSEEEDSEDVPMWKSFLERDNPDDEPSFYFDEGSDEDSEEVTDEAISFYSDEDEINETPIINISDDANKIDDEIEHLSNWLAPDRERFLHSIFNDSKLAWEQALIDLTVFDDWKSASKYLENEIFNKNRIDIYSEVAVDFTDYLHSYFMEYKS
jgi:hypothetical protein